jgi:hypothetical protein
MSSTINDSLTSAANSSIRHFLEDAFALLDADLDPSWHSNLLCQLQSLGNTGLLLGLLTNSDDITSLHHV